MWNPSCDELMSLFPYETDLLLVLQRFAYKSSPTAALLLSLSFLSSSSSLLLLD